MKTSVQYAPPFFHVEYIAAQGLKIDGQKLIANLYVFLPAEVYSGKLASIYISPDQTVLGKPLDINWGHLTLEYDLAKIPTAYLNSKYRFEQKELLCNNWSGLSYLIDKEKDGIIQTLKIVKKPDNYSEFINL